MSIYVENDVELFDCAMCTSPTSVNNHIGGRYLTEFVCDTCIEQYCEDPSCHPLIHYEQLLVFDPILREKLVQYIDHGQFKKTTKSDKNVRTYFVTFTYNNVADKDEWEDRVITELSKKSWITSKYCIEHKDTNIHAHALVTTKYKKTRRDFAVFERKFGGVNVKLVSKDNGILDYMEKECPGSSIKVVK